MGERPNLQLGVSAAQPPGLQHRVPWKVCWKCPFSSPLRAPGRPFRGPAIWVQRPPGGPHALPGVRTTARGRASLLSLRLVTVPFSAPLGAQREVARPQAHLRAGHSPLWPPRGAARPQGPRCRSSPHGGAHGAGQCPRGEACATICQRGQLSTPWKHTDSRGPLAEPVHHQIPVFASQGDRLEI